MTWQITSAILVVSLNLALGWFVYSGNKGKPANIFFGLLCVSLAIWASGDFLISLSSTAYFALLWSRFSYIGAVFAPAVILNLFYAIINRNVKNERTLFAVIYVATLFLLCAIPTPFLIQNVTISPFREIPGILYSAFILLFVFSLIFGISKLYGTYVLSKGIEKNVIAYVILSSILSLTALSVYFLTIYDMRILPIHYFIEIGYLSTVAYAITKEELMDIRVVIGRTAAYSASIVSALLIGLAVVSINSILFLNCPFLQFITISISILAAIAIFEPMRKLVQTPVDKWISWYEPEELLNSIVKELGLVSERESAFKVIAEQLKSKIKIKEVDIRLGEKSGYSDATRTKDGVIIPLSSSEGPEGAIILGQKTSEDPYDKRDFIFFETLSIQAKAILDRVYHYETVKKNFDSTQKKLYDTERLLARAEKIASLANLIREYNHEIKTPLSIIRGETGLMAKEARDAESLGQFRDLVFEQVDRANDIVESTLRLSEPKKRNEEELDVNSVIEGALKVLPPNGAHLEKNFAKTPRILGDRDDLKLVFVNLIKNALDAMPDGGTLKIKTYSAKENDDNLVCVEISDTGTGIPKENMEKIFEPFFSTHVTKGRGLGLSIAFRIMREHLGNISVKSEAGKGSAFTVTLRAIKS